MTAGKKQFTLQSEVNELYQFDCLREVAPYMFGHGKNIVFKRGYTFADIQKDHGTWDAKAAVDGVNRLLEIAESGQQFLFDLGTKEGRLLYYPAVLSKKRHGREDNKPYIILASGGGYFGVCTLVEAMPAAAYLNQKGFDVFCLNYRSGHIGLFPGVMEDMAAAVEFATSECRDCGLSPKGYIVGGFSAGGHLAGMWGTQRGYAKYRLPKPQAVWLNYPMVSADIADQAGIFSAWIVRRLMFGLFGGKKKVRLWALDENIAEDYPDTFLVMAKDDDTIPQKLYEDLKKSLKLHHVNSRIRHVESGSHGYGLGVGTKAEGWLDEAVTFWEACKQNGRRRTE